MNPELHERAQQVVRDAAGRQGAELETWLDQACGDDRELRQTVIEIFETTVVEGGVEPPTELVDDQGGIVAASSAMGSLAGQVLGSCVLETLIGEGGMGAVYAGVQQPWGRRVAVKVMRGGLGTDSARQRFEFEARVLANLQHAGIAQIYESGVHEIAGSKISIPYFVMEFVPGAQLLTDYADHEGLSLEARVRLMQQVCAAVHHGHLRGVIHRDLKPANVLVDENGQAKVIDFGVARTTEEDSVERSFRTLEGTVVGTPAYMSPEQLEGRSADLDARTDVYSLGVILFEMLSGVLPHDFAQRPFSEAVREVTLSPPPRPSARTTRRIPGDLDTVVQKALAKDRDHRYDGAAALGDDLGRVLEGLPIHARRPTTGYQLRLFARRNKTLVGAAAILLGVILASAAMLAVQVVQKEKARVAEKEKKEQSDRLVTHGRDLARWVINDLQPKIGELPGSTLLLRQLTERIAAYLDALHAEAADRPELIHTLAASYLAVGEILGDLDGEGNADRALAAVEAAIPLLEDVQAREPGSPQCRVRLATARLSRSDLLGEMGRWEETESVYRAIGDEVRDLVDHPEVGAAARRIVAGGSVGLAWLAARGADYAAAVKHLEQALVELGPRPAGASFAELHQRMTWEVQLLYWCWELKDTERVLAMMSALRSELDRLVPTEAVAVSARAFRARFHLLEGDFLFYERGEMEAALAEFQRAAALLGRLHAEDPAHQGFAESLATVLSRRGTVLTSLNRTEEAVSVLEENLALQRRLVERAPRRQLSLLNLRIGLSSLAMAHVKAEEARAARRCTQEAMALAERLVAEDPENPLTLIGLAEALSNLGSLAWFEALRIEPGTGDPAPLIRKARSSWVRAAELLEGVRDQQQPTWGLETQLAGVREFIRLCDTVLEMGEDSDRD